MSVTDYYQTLNVSKSATAAEIKSAYKRLAKKHHPDVNKSADAQDKFKEISSAYQVISDKDKRAAYDQMGHSNFEQARKSGYTGAPGGYGNYNANVEDLFRGGFGGSAGGDAGGSQDPDGFRDPFDIFEEFFGGRGSSGTSRSQANLRGQDLEVVMGLDFDEAVHGTEKEISYGAYGECKDCKSTGTKSGKKTQTPCTTCNGAGQVRHTQSILGASFAQVVTCPNCHGSGQMIKDSCTKCGGEGRARTKKDLSVKVPAGVDTGTRIRYSGKGNHGKRQGSAEDLNGDLYVVFKVKPHPTLIRNGQDIHVEVPVSPPQATLGTTIQVPTISGKKKLKIPAGTQFGKQLKLRDLGVPYINSTRRGDQIVTVIVTTSTKPSRSEKDLYQKLMEIEDKPQGFFDKLFT